MEGHHGSVYGSHTQLTHCLSLTHTHTHGVSHPHLQLTQSHQKLGNRATVGFYTVSLIQQFIVVVISLQDNGPLNNNRTPGNGWQCPLTSSLNRDS